MIALVLAALVSYGLDDALKAGLAGSPEVAQAQLDLQRAQVGLAGARSERLTYSADLSVADGYGINGIAGTAPLTQGQIPTANATLSARVPLFTGWRLERGIDQAQDAVWAGQANLDQVRQTVVWNVTEAYWLAKRAELHLQVARDGEAHARTARDIVTRALKLGKASEGDRDRAELALVDQRGEVLKAAADSADARDRLLTMVHAASALTLAEPPRLDDVAIPAEADALKAALAHRPDLRLAQAKAAAAQAARDQAAADRWPQLALEGAYQHGNNPYDPVAQSRLVLDHLSGDAYARVNLTYHLFDQGAVARNIASRQLEAEGAERGVEAARRSAGLEVRQALTRLGSAKERAKLADRGLALARRNLAYMEGRYRFGYALLTELNEARQDLQRADNQRADAAIDVALAKAGLARATGTLQAPR